MGRLAQEAADKRSALLCSEARASVQSAAVIGVAARLGRVMGHLLQLTFAQPSRRALVETQEHIFGAAASRRQLAFNAMGPRAARRRGIGVDTRTGRLAQKQQQEVEALDRVQERIEKRARQLRGAASKVTEGELSARVFGRGKGGGFGGGARGIDSDSDEDAGPPGGSKSKQGGALAPKHRSALQSRSAAGKTAANAGGSISAREKELRRAVNITMLSPRIRQLDEALASDRPEMLLPSVLLREQVAAYDVDERARAAKAARRKKRKQARREARRRGGRSAERQGQDGRPGPIRIGGGRNKVHHQASDSSSDESDGVRSFNASTDEDDDSSDSDGRAISSGRAGAGVMSSMPRALGGPPRSRGGGSLADSSIGDGLDDEDAQAVTVLPGSGGDYVGLHGVRG